MFLWAQTCERGQALGRSGWEPRYNRSLPWDRIQRQLPFPRGDERSQSHRRPPHQYWGQLAGGRKWRKTGYDRASPGLLHHVCITPICVASAWGFYPVRRPPPGSRQRPSNLFHCDHSEARSEAYFSRWILAPRSKALQCLNWDWEAEWGQIRSCWANQGQSGLWRQLF